MQLKIPALSLVVLAGPSGSGKSTFARRHFSPTEVISSDFCRALVADDEKDQSASADAFEVLFSIARKRLARGLLTVLDATHVKAEDQRKALELAREHDVLATLIALDLPPRLCAERNAARSDRKFGAQVPRQQSQQLRGSLKNARRDGFRTVEILKSVEEIDGIEIVREPLWTDRRGDLGPFDIIGDVHGCFDEMVELLGRLGYTIDPDPSSPSATPPAERKAVFLGDLVDRGPNSPAVLRLVMSMVQAGHALCVPGNHDMKLLRKLLGKTVQVGHGLAGTLKQLEEQEPELKERVIEFLDGLVSHLVLDRGRLVVAHAGLKQAYQGRASARVRDFALYGETTGERDEFGLPVRYPWAEDYRGPAMVVYGHTPVLEPEWLNRTICIDTGCAFGGKLSALRYPERELVQVEARQTYFPSPKPLAPSKAEAAPARPVADLLDIEDVSAKRPIETRLGLRVNLGIGEAAAALEAMSRFAVDPRWLIYLPPTMAPAEACREGDLLESPAEVFKAYRKDGVTRLICQEKHMGSRAVIVLCKDRMVAARRFADDGQRGVILTRTGRSFFTEPERQVEMVDRLAAAVSAAGLWQQLETDWLCLDAEIMPWSAKAKELLRQQYAPTGAAALAGLASAISLLESAAARDDGSAELLARTRARRVDVENYVAAYRRYCWDVKSLEDLKVAPFYLLAAEGRVFFEKSHLWHLETIGRLAAADPALIRSTPFRLVDLDDHVSEEAATAWWHESTAAGGEGMVVKPLDGIVKGPRSRLVQPALKCRGREYLRIIYGPEYTQSEHLERLRRRSTGAKKALALKEFALGVEGLSRLAEGEPLYRVHECVFGVLALESEPIDPRL